MSAWTKDELHKIAASDDLHISPFREDGVTYGTPTWVWSVVVRGALYVRAYTGKKSRWYQAAAQQGKGCITVGGLKREVTFKRVDDDKLNHRINEAYREKYDPSPYVKTMIGVKARAATVKIMPTAARPAIRRSLRSAK